MPADYYVTDSDMKKVADAIRTKGGTTAPLVFPDGMVQAINAIQTGGGGGGEKPRLWTNDDFKQGGHPSSIRFSIKPELRQYFIVGDSMHINMMDSSASWYTNPVPGLTINSNWIMGIISGGTELDDVMQFTTDEGGIIFKQSSGSNIPIKNP